MGNSKGKPRTYTLTEQEIKNLARKSADEAIKAYIRNEKNEYKKAQDRRLYNMKILLDNYHKLNQYADTALYNVEQLMDESVITQEDVDMLMKCGLSEDDLLVKSVASGAIKVKALMAQVNKMLEVYKHDCQVSTSRTKQRQYRVLYSMYLGEELKTAKEIAEEEGEELRTIQNDAKAAREELTPLIFGIDGLLNRLLRE